MTDITYVELAQNKSSIIRDTGDYTINLDNPIIIEEGDQVALYKSFIDTTLQQTEKIKLTSDIQLNLSFIMYARNWWGNVSTPVDLRKDGVFMNGAEVSDNKDYMICEKISNPGAGVLMTEISYGLRSGGGAKNKFVGGFTGNYSYTDINGNTQVANIVIGRRDALHGPKTVTSSALSINCINNSFVDITPIATLLKANCYNTFPVQGNPVQFTYDTTPITADFHISPIIKTVNLKVPQGSYDPNVLAEYITDQLTRVDELSFQGDPQGSPFLTSGKLLGMSNELSKGVIQESASVAVSVDRGLEIFNPISGGTRGGIGDAGSGLDYIVGASQVALTFQNNSIFTWEFIHTPYYVGGAGTTKSIGIEYVETNTTTNTYEVVNKYGGIVFTDLSANVLDEDGNVGESFDFWEDILKFDIGSICVNIETIPSFTFTDTNGTSLTGTSTKLDRPLKDGITTTGGLISIDATVDKASNTPFTYTKLTPPLCIPTEVSGTFGIQATTPYDFDESYDTPYFRVDIESSIKNNIVGEKTLFRNTFAIVGRYYELNSYNTGSSSDSLVYVHKGEPVVMSSLNVRILDNKGVTPLRLGDDNTIYLQVVKSK